MDMKEIASGLQRDALALFDGQDIDDEYFLKNYGIKEIRSSSRDNAPWGQPGVDVYGDDVVGNILAEIDTNGVIDGSSVSLTPAQNALFSVAAEMIAEMPTWYFDRTQLKLPTEILENVKPEEISPAIMAAIEFYTDDRLRCPYDASAEDETHDWSRTDYYRTQYHCEQHDLYFTSRPGAWSFERRDADTDSQFTGVQELNDKTTLFRTVLQQLSFNLPLWFEHTVEQKISLGSLTPITSALAEDPHAFDFLSREVSKDVGTLGSTNVLSIKGINENRRGIYILAEPIDLIPGEFFTVKLNAPKAETSSICSCEARMLLNQGCKKHL